MSSSGELLAKPVEKEEVSPFDSASFWSKWTYLYPLPLFRVGATRPLLSSDLPKLAERDELPRVARRVKEAWLSEVLSKKDPSFARAMLRCFRTDLLLSGFFFFLDFAAVVAVAEILRPLVNWLASSSQDYKVACFWAVALLTASLVNVTCHHGAFYMLMRCGWNARLGVSALIHEKLLRIRSASLSRVSTGFVLSLVTTDAQRFDNLLPFIHAPWVSLVLGMVVFGLLTRTAGVLPAAAGCVVVASSVAIQVRLGFRFQKLRALTAGWTDKRVKLISEVLSGIFTVKAASWEKPFTAKIAKFRAQEAANILRSQHCKAITSGLFFCTVAMATFALFATLFFVGGNRQLRIGDVASIIALLNALRQIVSFGMAYFMMAAPEMLVATRRMQRFMELPEVLGNDTFEGEGDLLARAKDAAFTWSDDVEEEEAPLTAVVLRDVNFRLTAGRILAVRGPVGCGKSSLLEAMNGELTRVAGSVELRSDLAIVSAPQRAWIVASTLRANVLLGAPSSFEVDEALYARALKDCALTADLEQLEHGDATLLGERGVNLSGGQQARVALARALYAALFRRTHMPEVPVLALLDDPLAALDANVANHVLEHAILAGFIGEGCGVLVASHSKMLLDHADTVLTLAHDGAQTEEQAAVAAADVPADVIAVPADVTAVVVVEEKQKEKKPPPQMMKEERQTGSVTWDSWLAYAKSGGLWNLGFVVMLFVIGQGCLVATDLYILDWAGSSGKKSSRMLVYGVLSAATVFFALLRASLFYSLAIKAANGLHDEAAGAVLEAPLHFHHATPRGRILARFASDQGNVDELLAQAIFDLFQLGLMMAAVVAASIAAVPFLALAVPPLAVTFVRHKQFIAKSMTELKRLDQLTRSPVVATFADTLNGLGPIRAFGKHLEKHRHEELMRNLDSNARAWFWWLLTQRFLGFYLDVLSCVFLAVLVVLSLSLRSLFAPEVLALGLLYAVQLSGNLQWVVRQFALAESFMSSVERLLYYGRSLPTEDEQLVDDDVNGGEEGRVLPVDWPRTGRLELRNLRVRYRQDLPDVLCGVSFAVPSGAKVGIVGRSGSGKSSLVSALSRLNTISGGSVLLDGVDTRSVPLKTLRNAVAVIPQDPHLFSGTLRFNLDPFNKRTDAQLTGTLLALRLDLPLDRLVDENGANFSLGERQLLCTARALLLDRKIICIDEATASVDRETDALIQRTMREAAAFKEATVLVIAHRISTIRDSDLVIVLEAGSVVEAGPPTELLENKGGPFAKLTEAAARHPNSNMMMRRNNSSHAQLQEKQ